MPSLQKSTLLLFALSSLLSVSRGLTPTETACQVHQVSVGLPALVTTEVQLAADECGCTWSLWTMSERSDAASSGIVCARGACEASDVGSVDRHLPSSGPLSPARLGTTLRDVGARLDAQTDLIRIAVLYAFGGTYFDVDVVPVRDVCTTMRDMRRYPSLRHLTSVRVHDADLDEGLAWLDGSRSRSMTDVPVADATFVRGFKGADRQLADSVIAAAPGSPLLLAIAGAQEAAVAALSDADRASLAAEQSQDYRSREELTGPGVVTRAITTFCSANPDGACSRAATLSPQLFSRALSKRSASKETELIVDEEFSTTQATIGTPVTKTKTGISDTISMAPTTTSTTTTTTTTTASTTTATPSSNGVEAFDTGVPGSSSAVPADTTTTTTTGAVYSGAPSTGTNADLAADMTGDAAGDGGGGGGSSGGVVAVIVIVCIICLAVAFVAIARVRRRRSQAEATSVALTGIAPTGSSGATARGSRRSSRKMVSPSVAVHGSYASTRAPHTYGAVAPGSVYGAAPAPGSVREATPNNIYSPAGAARSAPSATSNVYSPAGGARQAAADNIYSPASQGQTQPTSPYTGTYAAPSSVVSPPPSHYGNTKANYDTVVDQQYGNLQLGPGGNQV